MKKIKIILLTGLAFLLANQILAQSDHILWYKQAAKHFEETLVLGNGKMGASVFGGIKSDKIYLNDATLWSGEPVNANMNPEAYKNIPAIREALKNENYQLANELNKKLQGSFSESFAPLGTMSINFKHKKSVEKYYRELDISTAIAKVSYEISGVKYTREYFVSHPDKVMIIKLTASKKKALNFDIDFNSKLKFKTSVDKNVFAVNGYAPYHTEPSYRGMVKDAVVFDPNRGTRFTSLFEVKSTDGKITVKNDGLELQNASEAIIYVSIATSFSGFDKNPATEGLDHQAKASGQLLKALTKTYADLKTAHINDYQHFFNRVQLNLGKTSAPNLPADERLKRYDKGKEDKMLEVLYFQFGRYLLISSSRTKAVPANLQGIWNPHIRPPWSSNYTMNINLEENYWLAENTNLSEMHLPLIDFIGNLAKTGKITAKTFYDADGWTACHNSDIWAMSNPVGDFGKGDPVWANWNMGGAWLSTHLWEHYIFTQDIDFLKDKGYPLMKGATQFCLSWLVEDGKGHLITSPSTSPENVFITTDGYKGSTLYGGTADLSMIRECLQQTIKASEILGVDNEFRTGMQQALAKLYPYQIGKKGNLQEWYFDWEDVEPQHRHQSHLFGLYPGHQVTPDQTPNLANACRKTLEIKGDEATGWSIGWRINLWARLWDGNHAYKLYRQLLHAVEPDGVKIKMQKGGGTYPNLLDAHPPFQIDGNFSGAAAVAEMLLQSTDDKIILLPALPDAWANGSVKGLVARGGFVLDIEWEKGKLVSAIIYSKTNANTKVKYNKTVKEIALKEGESYRFTAN